MLQFIIERANYWAIIGLMMVGLYIAFQSTNMIKRLVGLSVFQTSVFLFYITLGKVAGGSAPILYGRDLKKGHSGGHGEDHGPAEAAAGHSSTAVADAAHSDAAASDTHAATDEVAHIEEETVDPADTSDLILPEADHSAPVTLNPGGLEEIYSNPLPHVLILTAIVVGVATLAVGLAIVVRIREAYGSIESDEVRAMDIEIADAQDADDIMGAGV